MDISKLSVKRPVTIAMVTLIIVIMGFVSLSQLAVDLFPNIELPIALVVTQFEGAGPKEVEKMVGKPIEDSLATLEGLENITTNAMNGAAITILEFDFGTDMDMKAVDIRESVDMVKGYLPDDAEEPLVMKLDINAMPVMYLTLSGDKSISELEQIAEDIVSPKLERIGGVASVSVTGGLEQEVQVNVSEEVLSGYGLTTGTLAQLIASENFNTPLGNISKGPLTLNLRQMGEFGEVSDIQDLTITLPYGGQARLEEIADVRLAEKKLDGMVHRDGERTINISVQKSSDANTVEVARAVRAEIASLQGNLQGANLEIFQDTATNVENSIGNVVQSAVLGGLLAVVILYLFLRHFKSTLVIGLSIPISIIATFILIYYNGITLNMMTLGGLTLGVGMLVDNSIVVLENIFRYRTEGVEPHEAAIRGANEVRNAIFASTLTTVVVFLPMTFVDGIVSILFRDFSLTVVMSLLASLFIALTLVPMLASKLLTSNSDSLKTGEKKAGIFKAIEKKYRGLLAYALKHRKTVIITTVVMFAVSMGLIGFVGAEFFPASDMGQISVTVKLPEGSALDKTQAYVERIESSILEVAPNDVKSIMSSTGYGDRLSTITGSTSTNSATINVILNDLKERKTSDKVIADQIRSEVAKISGADIQVSTESSSMSSGTPIEILIKGDDLGELEVISENLAEQISKVDGTKEVETSMEDGLPEVQLVIDREKANQYGITSSQISSAVKSRVDGITASRIKLNEEEINIVIKSALDEDRPFESLQDTGLMSPLGVTVPLSQVADIIMEEGPSTITRLNQERYVSITSDVFGRELSAVNADVVTVLDAYEMPAGYTYELGGEAQEMQESFVSLMMALGLSVIFVYMIIASQFESLVQPFVIMFSVPLAMSGGLLGLALTGTPLSVPAMIGMIMLAGVVVNNAIVLVDAVNLRRERGESRAEAIMAAGPIRLRPILMTTLTTVLGLMPMALALGEGSESMAPMARFVVGGLLLSTLLTLVFIPVLYTVADDMMVKFAKKKSKKKEKELEAVLEL